MKTNPASLTCQLATNTKHMQLLTEKLTREEIKEILEQFTDLTLEFTGNHGYVVIYKEDGRDFYGDKNNEGFTVDTLEGLIKLMRNEAFVRGQLIGRRLVQASFRNLLGL